MTALLNFIHHAENSFACCAEQFIFWHPYLTFLAMFIGIPAALLLAVYLCAALAALPLLLIFGWL